jgi:hypothetical protein
MGKEYNVYDACYEFLHLEIKLFVFVFVFVKVFELLLKVRKLKE